MSVRRGTAGRVGVRVGIGVLAAALGVGGCAGLPAKPQPPVLAAAAPLSDADFDGGGNWPAHEWWHQYHDATLDELIVEALSSSPTLATAHARFDSATQSVRIAGAATGAHLSAVADADRQRLSDNGVFPPQLLGFYWYDQYDLALQATYTFDWWGKERALVGAAIDQAHASQADRTAAELMLASSVTDAYFGWQADQSRLTVAREREATAQNQAAIVAFRIRAQLEPEDNTQRSEVAIAAAREQIAILEGSARLRVVAIAALVGRPVAQLPTLTAKPLPAVHGGVPSNVGIDLIARRADITASRWRVEATQKNRDSARAEFFPDVSLNGLIGLQSIDIGNLLKYGSRVPQVAAAIHLPIFDEGRLKAQYGATQAAISSAVANYQETLVTAAREVATQAATRAQLAAQRAQRQLEVEAAQQLKVSAAARVRQGLADSRVELDATQTLLEQRDALLQLDAAALSADIGLQRALGGGYQRNQTTP